MSRDGYVTVRRQRCPACRRPNYGYVWAGRARPGELTCERCGRKFAMPDLIGQISRQRALRELFRFGADADFALVCLGLSALLLLFWRWALYVRGGPTLGPVALWFWLLALLAFITGCTFGVAALFARVRLIQKFLVLLLLTLCLGIWLSGWSVSKDHRYAPLRQWGVPEE